ncbi:MAG: c-type cytochrome [Cytophagales bacterium]|nr:c-type cytochrome [Cytophagales bacterium]
MKLRISILLLILSLVLMSLDKVSKNTVTFEYPKDWPKPTYTFKNNPLTEEGIMLGRKLFYDPKLSKDGMISCASCHLSFTSFTHVDHKLSHGVKDRIGRRNTGALINLAWQKDFMWDGSINHLDFQPLAPLTSEVEMGGNLDNIQKYLSSDDTYKSLFFNAFGDSIANTPNMLKAFSQFMLQFNSFNSKYDKVKRGEMSFSESEIKGYQLFQTHCNSCHTEPLFTNNQFMNNGLTVDTTLQDMGRIKVTGLKSDSLKFKVPTLRNIEVTYPYMHDGRFKNLPMVLLHYSQEKHQTFNIAKELKEPIVMTEGEKRSLIHFLKTLTDKEFLYNQDLSFPRN